MHSVGVRIGAADLRSLDWPDPVIAHFNGRDPKIGHFRVIFASTENGRSIRVWDGLAGETAPTAEMLRGASGMLLLTSRSPIDKRPRCLNSAALPLPMSALAVAVVCVLLVSAALVARLVRGIAKKSTLKSWFHFF